MRALLFSLVLASAVGYGGKPPGERQKEILRRQVAIAADGSSGAPMQQATAVLAAGCFWGVELAFARLPGVLTTEVGYTGGKTAKPTYQDVTRGDTMHAEAVRVVYDAAVLPLRDLLSVFFDAHDPTTPNRQGNDVGTQYRSAIFVDGADERAVAEAAIEAERQRLGRRVATTVESLGPFTPAEGYHRARPTPRGRPAPLAAGLCGVCVVCAICSPHVTSTCARAEAYLAKRGQTDSKGNEEPIRCYG